MDALDVAAWVRLATLAVLALMAIVVFTIIVCATRRQLRDSDSDTRRAAEGVVRQLASLLRFLLTLMVVLAGGPSVAAACGRLAELLQAGR